MSEDQDQPQDLSTKSKEQPAEQTPPPRVNGRKTPPDVLCTCPQKCDSRVAKETRSRLLEHFGKLRDHQAQNAYLQSYIEMRSVYRRLWAEEERVRGRLPRRVSCKYRVPVSDLPLPSALSELPKPRLITNSKGKATFVMAPRGRGKTIEVCQKAFMNVYGITEKRVRLQREKLIAKLRNRSPPPPLAAPLQQLVTNTTEEQRRVQTEQATEGDQNLAVAIVDSFFENQLWKPEYIGISKEKLSHIKV